MGRLFIWGPACLIVLMLAGCSSLPQTEYYRLSCDYDDQGFSDEHINASLELLPFKVAFPYARTEIAYRKNDYRIYYDRYRQWTAAPAKLVREEVGDYIRASGIFDKVYESPSSHTDTRYTLRARIREFVELKEDNQRFALLRMDLMFTDTRREKQLIVNTCSRTPIKAGGDLTGFARAMSRNLEKACSKSMRRIIQQHGR